MFPCENDDDLYSADQGQFEGIPYQYRCIGLPNTALDWSAWRHRAY